MPLAESAAEAQSAGGPVDLSPTAAVEALGLAGTQAPPVAAQVVDMRVLLLSSGDDEPSLQAWRVLLESVGVPFDVMLAGVEPVTAARLEHGPRHGRYQAIVLATDSLVRLQGGAYLSSLGVEEWRALYKYESTYGVRQVSAYATPGPSIGLQPSTWAGDLGETTGAVTEAGRAVFPELVGPVPLSPGTYGFVAAAMDDADFTTLVVGESGSPIVGVVNHTDGREELVVTVASSPYSRHTHLLGHGMLRWATRGRYLGRHHFYLSVQIDDVLLGSTPPVGEAPVRMAPDDVRNTARWSHENGIKLYFAYNGWGSVTATMSGAADPLTDALIESADQFNWLNHTFGHLDLDHASDVEIHDEVTRNLEWAYSSNLPVEPDSLVTGAHSGLDNPRLLEVLESCDIRWLASDASRETQPRQLGSAHTVPRHPVNIPLDVSTREGLLRRRSPATGGSAVSTMDWVGFLSREAGFILDHMLSNDPRPHYTHQNALVGDQLLLGLLDVVLQSYRGLIAEPTVQLSLAEAGQELLRRNIWSELCDTGGIVARDLDGTVEIENRTDAVIDVPYAGKRNRPDGHGSNWIAIPARSRCVMAY